MTYPTFQFVGNHIFYTTLDGAITGATDPIYVIDNSAAEDAPGLLKVENEIIYYGVKGSNQFSNLIRGYGGTVATGHASGVEVCHPFACDTFQKIWDGIESLKSEDISIAGVKTFSDGIKTDTINEETSGAGVTIDGVLIKDNLQTSGIAAYVESVITTSITSSATPTPARASKKTEYVITALAKNTTLGNPTGTLANGDLFLFSIKDDGTSRTIAYGDKYTAPYSFSKPTATTISKTLLMLFRYNSASSKWELLYTDMEV